MAWTKACSRPQMRLSCNGRSIFPDRRSCSIEAVSQFNNDKADEWLASTESEESTFISSTKEGNPPIAMKVRNAATNISIDPLACIYFYVSVSHDFLYWLCRIWPELPELIHRSFRCRKISFQHKDIIQYILLDGASNSPSRGTCWRMIFLLGRGFEQWSLPGHLFFPKVLHPRMTKNSYKHENIIMRVTTSHIMGFQTRIYPFTDLGHSILNLLRNLRWPVRFDKNINSFRCTQVSASLFDVLDNEPVTYAGLGEYPC